MKTRCPRAVIFDFDGTLIDSEGPDSSLLERLLAEEGLPLSQEEILRLFAGISRSEVPGFLEERFGFRVSDAWFDRYRAGRDILEGEARVSDDAIAFFRQLKNAGIACAMASNSREPRLMRMVRRVGIEPWFEGRFFHLDLGCRSKPAPDLYLKALDGLGLAADDVLAIEDSPVGVQAARAADVPCLGFTGYCRLAETPGALLGAGALATVSSMAEAAAYIELNQRKE